MIFSQLGRETVAPEVLGFDCPISAWRAISRVVGLPAFGTCWATYWVVVVKSNCLLPPQERTSCTARSTVSSAMASSRTTPSAYADGCARITSSCPSTTTDANGSMESNALVASSNVSSSASCSSSSLRCVSERHHEPKDSTMVSLLHTLEAPQLATPPLVREHKVNALVNFDGTTRAVVTNMAFV